MDKSCEVQMQNVDYEVCRTHVTSAKNVDVVNTNTIELIRLHIGFNFAKSQINLDFDFVSRSFQNYEGHSEQNSFHTENTLELHCIKVSDV